MVTNSKKADWGVIRQSSAFHHLMQQKKAFILPSTIFFMVFYFILPVLTAFTSSLDGKVIGAINWAYIYAFAQFIMTWVLSHMYLKKAREFDQLAKKVKDDVEGKGESAK
ncbi:DUF485 domain-containing protein [Ferviditalea candida]|uniref:DUF485 domain-containing protein n=1 Tax=Ferviditalea candida TaxID=3108399 RepID=A0ABU5ZHD4_9BACL|nr:DUF485 domain-containing protein [Paenibacillaceae bacterium T2]